jgi:hypothetical protein
MGYLSYYFYGLSATWISIFVIVALYLLFTGKSTFDLPNVEYAIPKLTRKV